MIFWQRSILIFCCALLIIPGVCVGDTWVGLGWNLRFERETSGSGYSLQHPFHISVGRKVEAWGYGIELSRYIQSTGSAVLEIGREQYELLALVQYYPLARIPIAYILAGGGLFQERLSTKIFNQESVSYSAPQWITALGIGVWGSIHGPLQAGAEIRLLASTSFNPIILAEFLTRVGYSF